VEGGGFSFVFPMALRPYSGSGSALAGLHGHPHWTHHTRQDSPGRVISPTQRTPPDNTQQSRETDIHVPGGVRTHNPSKRAAVDPRLRAALISQYIPSGQRRIESCCLHGTNTEALELHGKCVTMQCNYA